MRKLVPSVALSLAVALLGVPAHSATTHAAGKVHLSIMVGGLSKQIYLPNMLAQRLGYFTAQNLDVTLIDEASGQASEDAVIAGQVQAGSGAYNHTIQLQVLGKQLVDVVQLTNAPGEAEMVATKMAGKIKSAADLRGKTLGITEFGSGTQTLTTVLLNNVGIPVNQVHFLPVGAGDTFIAAVKHGQIDAGMTTEPTISRLVQTGDAKVLIDLRTPTSTRAALGGPYPFICVFMPANYVSSHKDTVQRLVNAYVNTLKWINTHSATQIAAMMPADYYAGNKALYIAALKAQLPMYSPDGKMPAGGTQFILKVLQASDKTVHGKTVDLSKTYDGEFVAHAR